MTITNVNHDASLVAHLLRRAAFGATPIEFDRAVLKILHVVQTITQTIT